MSYRSGVFSLAIAVLVTVASSGCGGSGNGGPPAAGTGTGTGTGTSGGSGQVICRGIDIAGGTTGCSLSLNDCSDRHAYRVACISDSNPYTCSCQIDGTEVSTFSSASTPFCKYTSNVEARPAAVQACGWTLLQ